MYHLALKLWYILFDYLKINNSNVWNWWKNNNYYIDHNMSFIRWLKTNNKEELQNIITSLKQEILKQRL